MRKTKEKVRLDNPLIVNRCVGAALVCAPDVNVNKLIEYRSIVKYPVPPMTLYISFKYLETYCHSVIAGDVTDNGQRIQSKPRTGNGYISILPCFAKPFRCRGYFRSLTLLQKTFLKTG
jgi:hypothetical protein